MAPLSLRSLKYSFCLLSLIWDNLYYLPFDDGFFTLCPLLKLLWLSWTTLFCLNRSNYCVCIPPGRLISTSVYNLKDLWHYLDVFQLILYVVSSFNLVLLLELLHFLLRHLSDQVYKLLQYSLKFIIFYIIFNILTRQPAFLQDSLCQKISNS